jgi:hypothetical protein
LSYRRSNAAYVNGIRIIGPALNSIIRASARHSGSVGGREIEISKMIKVFGALIEPADAEVMIDY